MSDVGTILAVSETIVGSEVAADTLAGSTTLPVQDSSAFASAGGKLEVAGARYDYVSVDYEADIITLASALAADVTESEPVAIIDAASNVPATETRALVELDEGMEPVNAAVPFMLRTFLPVGIRDYGMGEQVTIDWLSSGAVVADVLGQAPSVLPEALPEIEAGNSVYYGATPPWENGDALHADDSGDIWWQEITDPDGSVTRVPWLWDGVTLTWVNASDPNLSLIDTLVETVDDLSTRVDTVSDTATSAHSIATTADGRVTFSDYDPSPDDITYLAFDYDGNPIIDPATGLQMVLQHRPGSLWHTRTRERRNECVNPSFEVDLTGWTTTDGAAMTRVAAQPDPAVGGAYAAQVANAVGVGGGAKLATALTTTPGDYWALSAYVRLVSGDGAGAHLIATVKASDDTVLATHTSPTVTATVDAWVRPQLVLSVGDGAAALEVEVRVPGAGAVWQLDGVDTEEDDIVGRYFDGSSEQAEWTGTPHASVSHLFGGRVTDVYELQGGAWVRMDYTGTTQYDSDASDLTKGTLNPDRIADHSLGVDKIATNVMVAYEPLSAGMLVHAFDNNGVALVRKASSSGYEAHGFVLDTVATGAEVAVYTFGYNPFKTGLIPGKLFLGTNGDVSHTAPTSAGSIVQVVGFASDATTMHFAQGQAIRIM